jgi:hypothetical protein
MAGSVMPSAERTRSGFTLFAGIMLLIAATFNLLDGVAAIAKDDHFRVDELLFGSLTAWGIWWLVCGAAQFIVGLGVLGQRAWGALFGIALAGVNALTQLMFIAAYPAWSIAAMVVDGLIIYGLTVKADEFD